MLACDNKPTFADADMQKLSEAGHMPGTWASVLGPSASDVQHKLCARKMLMIDRVTHVLPRGGAHGLGLLIGEKSLERDHWYFPCHFKDDQVMAGSLVSDGCSQMLKLYMSGSASTRRSRASRSARSTASRTRCAAAARSRRTRAS